MAFQLFLDILITTPVQIQQEALSSEIKLSSYCECYDTYNDFQWFTDTRGVSTCKGEGVCSIVGLMKIYYFDLGSASTKHFRYENFFAIPYFIINFSKNLYA